MATQFEVLQDLLTKILVEVRSLRRDIDIELDLQSRQELDFSDEVPDEGNDPAPSVRPRAMNRREIEVRGFDGQPKMVPWESLDPRIVMAIRIATEHSSPYELYEDFSGHVRIQVDNEIAHLVRKQTTTQAPVPVDVQPDKGMDIDEIARPR